MSDAGLGSTMKGQFIQSEDRPPVPPELIFYTATQVAHLLEVSLHSVKRYLIAGELRGMKIGGQWRISQPDLRAFVTERYAETET